MVATSSPIEIFCSYAHEDESWLLKLETHLSLLKRQGLISLWHDRLIASGIRRALEDLSLLTASAPRAALPAIWNIPYPRNPFFLGRESALEQLRHHLYAGQTTALSQPQAISGLGGIGKTQLALEYAYRYGHNYQAVFWTRADDREALISGFVTIAELLNLPEKDEQDQTKVVTAVKGWLRTHSKWL